MTINPYELKSINCGLAGKFYFKSGKVFQRMPDRLTTTLKIRRTSEGRKIIKPQTACI